MLFAPLPDFGPSTAEKVADYLAALILQDATRGFHLPVQLRFIQCAPGGFNRASLGLKSTINKTTDAAVHYGANAHSAGFQGDIKRCPSKTIIPFPSCSIA